jgi:hypothetical protein
MNFKENFSFYKESSSIEKKDQIKYEHPFVCLIDKETMDEKTVEEIKKIKEDGQYVNFCAGREFAKQYEMFNQDRGTYIISSPNPENKYSEGFFNCTGLVGIGIDRYTKERVSFLSHQNPEIFLGKEKQNFKHDLERVLKTFKEKIEPNSLYISGFGGQYEESYQIEYLRSVKFLSGIVENSLGSQLPFIAGPNASFNTYNNKVVGLTAPTEIYVDTKQNRIYLVRPHQENNSMNHPFTKDTMLKQDLRWRRE